MPYLVRSVGVGGRHTFQRAVAGRLASEPLEDKLDVASTAVSMGKTTRRQEAQRPWLRALRRICSRTRTSPNGFVRGRGRAATPCLRRLIRIRAEMSNWWNWHTHRGIYFFNFPDDTYELFASCFRALLRMVEVHLLFMQQDVNLRS